MINDLSKMQSLMERMEKRQTLSEAEETLDSKINGYKTLNESIDELNANGREDVPINDFLDMITGIKGGTKVAFGYVSVANLNIPTIKRKNPETNRMKSYPDWETFSSEVGEENVAGVLKFTRYHLNWRNVDSYNKHYLNAYKNPVNTLRNKYGVEGIADKEADYTSNINYQSKMKAYSGDNEALKGHSYSDQDLAGKGTKVTVQYFLINTDGHIIREISADELKNYFKASTSRLDFGPFKKLFDQGYSEEQVEELYQKYMEERKNIQFKYGRFEHTAIVYMIASVNGERKRFFNGNLREKVGDVLINPLDFINLAKKMYQVDDQELKDSDLGDIEE